MIKAFNLIKSNRIDIGPNLNEINEFIKEVSISQSNLENIFIEVEFNLMFSSVIYIRIKFNIIILQFLLKIFVLKLF